MSASQPIPIPIHPTLLLQDHGWILPSWILYLPLHILQGRNLLPQFFPFCNGIIIGVVITPPIEQYPHGDVVTGTSWVDTQTCTSLQERPGSGNQINIHFYPSSYKTFTNQFSTPFPLTMSLSLPSLWCS